MLSKRDAIEVEGATACDLTAHVGTFVESLAAGGYAAKTQRVERRIVEVFLGWAREARLAAAEIDESCVDHYLLSVLQRPYRRGRCERGTLYQFIEHLRARDAVPPRRSPEPSSADVLVGRYAAHLRDARGLSKRSLAVYTPPVRGFVLATALADADDIEQTLDATVLREYVLDRARGASSEVTRLLTVALRSCLRFLFVDGLVSRDLSAVVPTVRRWQLAAVPPLLAAEEVERVLVALDLTTARGRRDRAVLLLVARLGLRPGEVVGLELGDLRWAAGEIVVRGKGGLEDRLPLLCDVGEALAVYLRKDRGSSVSRGVFQRLRAPCGGFAGPSTVSAIARGALARAGKGRKMRCTPIRRDVAACVDAWLRERGGGEDDVLFPSSRGGPLSADALERLVARHVATASGACPSLVGRNVTPHCLRHTKAMAMLREGATDTLIALWLGHESVETVQHYLHADMRLKEQALARAALSEQPPPRFEPDDELLAFLESL